MRRGNPVFDKDGNELQKGDFFWLEKTEGHFLEGPYKYQGFKHGGYVCSIGDMEFFIQQRLLFDSAKLLDWERWRKKKMFFNLFETHFRAWMSS